MRMLLMVTSCVRASLDVFVPLAGNMVLGAVKARVKPYIRMGKPRAVQASVSRMQPQLAVPGGRHTMPPPGRRRGQLIVVAHISSNEHVEMYIHDPYGSGICHNIGVVALPAGTLRTNGNGWFTLATRETARSIFRNKAAGRDFIGLSTDHTYLEAVSQWNRPEDGPAGYGAGPIRQVIYVEDVEIYSNGSTVEFVSWWLNPDQPTYTHVVFPASSAREHPVGVIGFKQLDEPVFEDRLHMISDKRDVDKFRRNVGTGRASLKMDGASVHLMSDRNGTRYFSPRQSKESHRRIEYSFKMGQLQDITSDMPIKGMGELVFVDTRTGRQLSSAEIGGLLNADALPPEYLQPKIYIYRIDQVGRTSTIDEPYWEQNRQRCQEFASKHPQLDVPPEVPMDLIEMTKDQEGVVGVPPGKSLSSGGRKLKWRSEEIDATVVKVDFHPGPSGKVAGVVWYEDPSQPGRRFKTASGWTEEEKTAMMADPHIYEGRVMKLEGFKGHASRAVAFSEWHLDKGVA